MLNYFKAGSLSKKVGVVGFSKLLLSVNTFLINILFTRLLTKDMNGSYQQTLLVVNLFSMIFIFGVPTSIYYFFPRLSDSEKKGFLYQSVIILIGFGILTSSVMFFISGWIAARFDNPILSDLLKAAAPYLLCLLASSFSDAVLIALNRHKLMAFLTIIFTSLHFASVVVPTILGFSLNTVFISLGIVTSIKFIVSLFVCADLTGKSQLNFSSSLIKEQLFYIIPIGLNSVIDVFSKELDRTIVSAFFNVTELANYHCGALEIPLIGILTGSITAVLIPELAKCRSDERWGDFGDLFRSATVKTALIIFPLFGFLMLFAPQIFLILFTEAYLPGVPIFRIYLFMLPIRIVSFQAALFSLGKTKTVMLGAILDLLGNCILSIALIGFFGVKGVAIGLVAATICQALFYLVAIKKTISIPWEKLLDFKAFSKIGLACVLGLLPCFITLKTSFVPYKELIAGGVIFAAIYLGCFRFLFKK